jgi:hypothetical protein
MCHLETHLCFSAGLRDTSKVKGGQIRDRLPAKGHNYFVSNKIIVSNILKTALPVTISNINREAGG